MGDRLVWKRGRESQNDTGPSSSGKFETADKTSGHVSIQPDDFSRTFFHSEKKKYFFFICLDIKVKLIQKLPNLPVRLPVAQRRPPTFEWRQIHQDFYVQVQSGRVHGRSIG